MKGRKLKLVVFGLILLTFLAACSENPLADKEKEYTVSGLVTNFSTSGAGIKGVKIKFSDGQGTAATDEEGRWEKTLQGEVTVTPVKEGCSFEPNQATVSRPQGEVDFVVTANTADETPPVKAYSQPVELYKNKVPGDKKLAPGDEVDIYFSEAMAPEIKDTVLTKTATAFGVQNSDLNITQSDSGQAFYITYQGNSKLDISGGREIVFPTGSVKDAHGVKNEEEIRFLVRDIFAAEAVSAEKVTIYLEKSLAIDTAPDPKAFTVRKIASNPEVTKAVIAGGDNSRVELSLSQKIIADDGRFTVEYNPTGSGDLTFTSGSQVAPFTIQQAENYVPPKVVNVSTTGKKEVAITFDSELELGADPKAFTIKQGANSPQVVGAKVEEATYKQVLLAVDDPLTIGNDQLTIDYQPTGDKDLLGYVNGNYVEEFSGKSIENKLVDVTQGQEAVELTVGTETDITIENNSTNWLKFTADSLGKYYFYASDYCNVVSGQSQQDHEVAITVYDSLGNVVEGNDSDGDDSGKINGYEARSYDQDADINTLWGIQFTGIEYEIQSRVYYIKLTEVTSGDYSGTSKVKVTTNNPF